MSAAFYDDWLDDDRRDEGFFCVHTDQLVRLTYELFVRSVLSMLREKGEVYAPYEEEASQELQTAMAQGYPFFEHHFPALLLSLRVLWREGRALRPATFVQDWKAAGMPGLGEWLSWVEYDMDCGFYTVFGVFDASDALAEVLDEWSFASDRLRLFAGRLVL